MEKGPFHHLTNHWAFLPHEAGGCIIDFRIDFRFKHVALEKLIGALFSRATQKMVEAFSVRADVLYGHGLVK
jgi:coenzyme Q-binding protein COQ10